MLSQNINFINFKIKKKNSFLKSYLFFILKFKDSTIASLGQNFKLNYKKKQFFKYRSIKNIRLIGIGGSILGAKAIFNFLNHKVKKKIEFVDNLSSQLKKNHSKFLNLIVSKSGNTIETIVNANILISKKDQNIFITENKKNYLYSLAQKLKSEIIHHNNYIGGRYSVLSEVGMLPAEIMGLNVNKFKQLNNLIKNKTFINSLISNVASTIFYLKKKKFNSIIINYDPKSENLFKWYQQLIAESLGKKNVGILPVISNMPQDNHSLMQLYLDGYKNNFFTFFFVHENNTARIDRKNLLGSHSFLKNKDINQILFAQKKASELIFLKKKIPFRSFEVKKRDEKTLGELFCFFTLETILLAKALKVNPYDQPSVELIKKETKKFLI